MTSKGKKTNEPAEAETMQPQQQMAEEGDAEGGETYANIEPGVRSFANITPAKE